jgi:predicted oxidoreductase (fatty acid repression mutant protein)
MAEAAIKLSTKKISEYAAGYGTVLFFEDAAVVQANSARNPKYEKSNSAFF